MPFGYNAGSGASGSKKSAINKSVIAPAVPLLAPAVL